MSETVPVQWADGALDAAAHRARTAAPCPEREDLDPGGVLVSRLAALEACKARIDAEVCALLVQLTGRAAGWVNTSECFSRYNPTATEVAAAEVCAGLSWTTVGATVKIDLAHRLVIDLPATYAALAAGTIDLYKARIIADATVALDSELARKVEASVLGKACGQTSGELRAALRKASIEADPGGAEQRRTKARAGRSVRIQQLDDDMAALYAALAAEDAAAVYRHIDNLARAQGTFDERSMDQRRADILRDLILGEPLDKWLPDYDPYDDIDPEHRDTPDPYAQPAEPGEQAQDEQVEDEQAESDQPDEHNPAAGQTQNRNPQPDDAGVSESSTNHARQPAGTPLLDLTTTPQVLAGTSDEPAELAGYGPITAGHAREIAATGRATIHLIDELRRQLDQLRDTVYTGHDPPPRLAAAVRARDGTCRFPHCRQPAARCDLDHTTRWPDGPTALWNLGCLCRRHHGIKHATRWQVTQQPGGVLEWTSPTGRVYTTYPRGPAATPGRNDPDHPAWRVPSRRQRT